MSNDYANLIKNIKYFRLKANMTQEQLAEKSDLSVSYIKQIEAGKCGGIYPQGGQVAGVLLQLLYG